MTKSFYKVNPLNENDAGHNYNPDQTKNILELILDKIDKASPFTSLLLGVASGWITGSVTLKIGKIAAVGLGGGVILIQLANEYGYINVNWDKIKETSRQSPECFEKMIRYFKNNSYISAGFIGGLFFGIASSDLL